MNLIYVSVSFQDSSAETVILISPKFGISQINSLRNSVVSIKKLFIFPNRGRESQTKAQPRATSVGESLKRLHSIKLVKVSGEMDKFDWISWFAATLA